MSPRERDRTLPVIPEESDNKIRSSSWNDEDAEDREEQGLFEQDNVVAAIDDNNVNIIFDGDSAAAAGVPSSPLVTHEIEKSNSLKYGEGNSEAGPLYIQSSTGDSWELTWPIWHMLPRNERRAIATQHGMKSIGEFEEYMSLSRAVDDSEAGSSYQRLPDVEEDVEPPRQSPVEGWQPPLIFNSEVKEEDDDDGIGDDDDDENLSLYSDEDISPSSREAETFNPNAPEMDLDDPSEMIRLGGLPCSIPDEILHKAFSYLAIDDHASLALVSPYWSRFTRCESLYKSLCQRIYLNQSKRKALHVNHFGNSYRKMLEIRPRVRTGGGLYVLKYQEVRKIQRDMWTEIPVGAILESVYYRYLYFFEDGRVMYALTHATPMEMIPRFRQMILHGYGLKDKWGVWGRFQIKKDVVRIQVSHSWHDVCFRLKIIPSNNVLFYDWGDKGMYTTMVLEEHLSSASGNFEYDSYDLVKYEVPSHSYFRFLRDRRL